MKLATIGKNIRKYRLMKKLRQEDLAEKAGLTANYIGMVERGEKIPSLETFIKILNTLGVSADMVLSDVLDNGYTVKNSMLNEKLEKLNRQKTAAEKKLIAAQHREKQLEHERKRLTRSERTHRLCTRAGMLEKFLREPTLLIDDDVMELLTFLFHGEAAQKKLDTLIDERRKTLTTDGSENPLF